MPDEADRSNWTIKSVPVETRKLAMACATKSGDTAAQWLVKAVRNQANLEAGERVFPPVSAAGHAANGGDGLPALASGLPNGGMVGLGELAAAMEAARGLAEAAGVPVPSGMAREGFATIRHAMRRARGLAPRQPGGVAAPPIEVAERFISSHATTGVNSRSRTRQS